MTNHMQEVMKFEKKPVVVEAIWFQGDPASATPVINWILENGGFATWTEGYQLVGDPYVEEGIYIHTLEGLMRVEPGAWVIRGIQGEFYPCKQDIFEQTYTQKTFPTEVNDDGASELPE